MNTKDEKNQVFIGLDIGTESVGYALTDENYKVPQKSGKHLMGVRLFDAAETAANKRVLKANKVRSKRAKFRITLLQELFDKYIEKIDPLFFIRLECSSYWKDDKKSANEGLTTLDSLFAANSYTDKHYFDEFKTIYHLRRFLCDEKNWGGSKMDIRFVYLACHHILKARGHFLFSSGSLDINESEEIKSEELGKTLFKNLNEYLERESESDEIPYVELFNIDNFAEIEAIAKNDKLYLRDKKEKLFAALCPKHLGKSEQKRCEAIIRVILGSKVKILDIFSDDEMDDIGIEDVCFSGDFEKYEADLASGLGDGFELIQLLKNIYDWFTLMRLFKGKAGTTVSDSMIEIFENHNRQLKSLKSLVKEKGGQKTYHKVFRSNMEKNNYAAYIGSNLSNGKTIIKKCNQDDFYSFLKKELGDILTEEMKLEMSNNQFLQKLRTKDNATIPNQWHKIELKRILSYAVKYGLIDEDTANKTLSIFSFRVPYYVGRLNPYFKNFPDKKHHVWIEKRIENEKIRPWNFNEVVDLKKSNESFINRMLSQCTYLKNEKALPKNSLIYSKFIVLNELNKLRINNEPISVADKKRIFDGLFKTQKSVSVSALVKFLGNGIENGDISGIDVVKGKFNASYSPYIEARKIFGDDIDKEQNLNIVEDVILWQAVHTDKSFVEESIKEKYPHLDQIIVKKLKGLNYTGFGNFSKRFLTDCKCCDKTTGLMTSVLDILWNTNQNHQEIIYNTQYNVEEWVKSENYGDDEALDYSIVEDCYASPSVKRSVWQAMLVVDELIELNGGQKPDKIFIEVTRSNKFDKKDKGRTKTRRKMLEEKWKAIKNFEKDLKNELVGVSDDALRGEKLYLYFLQCGKCAYSGERINLSDLLYDMQNNLYDVDHIIPQALIKDDSLTNKVLVKRVLNAVKDKNYPLNKTVIWKNKDVLIPMWKEWNKYNLISSETLRRLTRTTPLSDKELEGFIARQLVFTGQSTTVVADLLKKKYEGTEIVYSKAENVSDFRHKFDFLKCRDLNDYHHAHDAYLNIVVGNTYNQRFNHNKYLYVSKYEHTDENWKTYSKQHLFEYNVDGAFKAGKWVKGQQIEKGETEKIVERHLSLKFLPVSKRTHENKGAFYEQTVWSSGVHQKDILSGKKTEKDFDAAKLIPRKGIKNPIHNVEKYGGFSGIRPAYFMIVEYTDKKGKKQREFTAVYLVDKKRWEKLTLSEQEAELSIRFKYPTKIVRSKILIKSLFEVYGIECRLSGLSNNRVLFHNAKQLFIDKINSDYMRIIAKYNKNVNDKKLTPEDYARKDFIPISGKADGKQTEYMLTKENNQKLWNELIQKIKKLYGGADDLRHEGRILHGFYDRIIKYQPGFCDLPIHRQINVLNSLVKGLGCNPYAFDLSEFNDAESVAKILFSFKINYPLVLINQSVTGVKENRIQIFPFEDEE